MVAKENTSSQAPEVKWIGCHEPNFVVPHLASKRVYFYSKCIIGALTLSVGDYVLVQNADAPEPDTVDGCDVAKLLCLYELREDVSDKDPYRAVVQWYSRPNCVPHKIFDSDEVCIDFDLEVIEEHRPYDADISLESVYRKCSVICSSSEKSAAGLINPLLPKRTGCPMFVCRYKFIKEKKSYRLVPLQFSDDADSEIVAEGATKSKSRRSCPLDDPYANGSAKGGSARKPKSVSATEKRRRASVAATNAVEFIDVNFSPKENKVSPIKIVGGRSVVRLSASAKKHLNSTDKREINGNYIVTSPLAERNRRVVTPTSRASAARRNLNLSLENGANTTADSDCLNYSIVKNTTNAQDSNNDMKIKLRLSESRRSTRISSIDKDPLAFSTDNDEKRAGADSSTPNNMDIYRTPKKASKEVEVTPSTRRKSILKSATRKLDGTPKRSIQLSNIVEKRVFKEDEIISTPKRVRRQRLNSAKEDESDEDEHVLRRSALKKASRARRDSVLVSKECSTDDPPMTPSQKLKLIRTGKVSPSIKQRKHSSVETPKSELQLAREQLHVSVVPKSLPCREKEFDNIYTFLEGKLEDQCGGCMYVSGVPGTGKTATVTGVIRSLQHKSESGELPAFDFLEINGMRLTEPRQAYVQIYKQLTGKTVSWEQAHSLLEKRFTTPAPRRVTTVLLVDELDILCNRRQDVVYNLLDWPTKAAARLVVITIANTMDLPERLLMGKVTSRLGLTRLTFQPYTHKQLQEIVTMRLSGCAAFKGDAVQLVARKVAAVSGDARRALDICRRATEIADTSARQKDGEEKCVNMLHVQQALAEMIASAKVQAIKNCSRLEQIFLQAVVAEVMRTGVEETSFMGVYSQVEAIAPFEGVTVPTPGRCLYICAKLGSQRLLISEHSRNDIFQKILLNASTDDIHYALKVNNV